MCFYSRCSRDVSRFSLLKEWVYAIVGVRGILFLFQKEFHFSCNTTWETVCGHFRLEGGCLWKVEFVVPPGGDADGCFEKICEVVLHYSMHPGFRYGLNENN